MGERQIRAQAERDGAAARQSQFAVLGDLAVAAGAAGKADELRATAKQNAQQALDAAKLRARQIVEDAEAEIERRYARWRRTWQAARDAGWTLEELRAAPIKQQQPPAAPKSRRAKTTADLITTPAEKPTASDRAGPRTSDQEASVPSSRPAPG